MRSLRPLSLVPCLVLLALTAAPAVANEAWTGRVQGAPEATGPEPPEVATLRFERAAYEVEVYGSVAAGVLTQRFVNDGERALTAAWAGEPPAGVRPQSLELEVDGESLEEPVASPPREPANRGARGSRPSRRPAAEPVATVPFRVEPGGSVVVRQTFQFALPVRDGLFRLSLAGVEPLRGGRTAADADGAAVPGSVRVRIHHADPLVTADSPTHRLVVGYEGDRTVVELAEGVAPASRPFELEFSLASDDEPAFVGFVGPEREGAHDLLLVFAPSVAPRSESIRPKQVLFVLDTSGSMRQGKLDRAREALVECMEKLGLDDHYNVIEFDSKVGLFRPQPVKAVEVGSTEARAWLDGLLADGGTQLLPALSTILDQPEDSERHRMILLLTDGIVRDEEPVLALLSEKLGATRLFVIGIGQDARHETIERLAEYGRGSAAFVEDAERLQAVLGELFGSIASPIAWDLALDWQGADVEILGTDRIPDLYVGRAVTIRARVRGELPSEVVIGGRTMDGERSFAATLPPPLDRDLPRAAAPRRPATAPGAERRPARRGRR